MMKKTILSLAAILLVSAAPVQAKKYPDQTADGLPRAESKRLDALYWSPDADLAGYTRVMIGSCSVEFRKNWQRDQNRNRASNRVTAEDMDRIRISLCELFDEVFTRELQERGDYEVVTEAGDDTLLLVPSIVDLDVFAPDVMAPGRSTTYTTRAGQMTLKMDIRDASTQALMGRVIDRKRASERGNTLMITNSVTNRAEADRILRRWASILRDALDDAATADSES